MLLQTKDLTKIYRTDEVETTSLNNINISVSSGEFVAVMGPSGCGKSTLLNIIGMLDNPTSGEYWFLDKEVSRFPEKQRAQLRKANIGFIFQSFNLIDELTVFENIELPLLYLGYSQGERRKKVEEVMERLQVTHRAKHYPQQLSGGQQQRVAVCRAIVINPQLLLADEPTGNLDSRNGLEVMKLLTELNEQGATVVMVTHSPEHSQYASRLIHLFDGQVVAENYQQAKVAGI